MFDKGGNFLGSSGSAGSATGQFFLPFGIVVEPVTGDLFIANQLNHRIDRWTAAGSYLSSFGQSGSGQDDFKSVTGLAIDANGDLWATDKQNHRVKKISKFGTTRIVFGRLGEGPDGFNNPSSVLPGQNGAVWVGSAGSNWIDIYGNLPVPTVNRSWGALKTTAR